MVVFAKPGVVAAAKTTATATATATDSTIFHYESNGKLIAETGSGGSKDYVYLYDIPVAVLQ